jgi:hypothetical protein
LLVAASLGLALACVLRVAHAQEQAVNAVPVQVIFLEESEANKVQDKQEKKAEGGSAPAQKFDQAVVAQGQAAFERSCTKCHDAARSLERTKDLAGWRTTVRRMAGKRGADIGTEDIEPIAVYLASRNASSAAATTGGDKDKAAEAAATSESSGLSAFVTLSPLWRGGNEHLQNPGFGPLAWLGASWQGKTVGARVTLCISCHGVQEQGFLSRIDVAEAAVRVDLSEYLKQCCCGVKGGIDAGRFIVPFGAFSSQTNPGLYHTVSTPLIFNMGQRLFNQDLGVPVLPMPYAATGIDLNLDVTLGEWCCSGPITATMDAYLINGLQGGTDGIDFLQSRNLLDNNDRVAGGGRLTVGDQYIRAGASITAGRFDDPSVAGTEGGLYYTIFGFDVQARYKRLIRCQFEYACRDSDRVGVLANNSQEFSERVDGYYLEAEARPWNDCCVSLLARYDFQSRSSPLPPSGSTLTQGSFDIERFTIGVNIELWHQSLLMIDFERWLLPEPGHTTADVFGVRFTITF